MSSNIIIEKKLGIPADYQYQAIRKKNFLFSNWHSNKFTVLKRLANFNKKSEILDLGIGSGNFELNYAHNVKSIVGIDYNDEAIAFAKKQIKKRGIKNVKLMCEDMRRLRRIKFAHKFDLIMMTDVLEHISIKDGGLLIASFAKLLKKDGYVCILTPNYKSSWIILEYILDLFSLTPKLAGGQHLAKYHKENLKNVFWENDYIVERIRTFNLFSFLFPIRYLSNILSIVEFYIPLPVGMMLAGKFKYK